MNNNTEDLSEKAINFENCHHCDINSQAFADSIGETEHFRIVCDRHPLIEGHILIIPKLHISCIGEYPENIKTELDIIYKYISNFIQETYGSVSTFEHGIIGQTVFHSHIHLMPFAGNPLEIIPEGIDRLKLISSLSDLREIFQKEKGYLFFSIGESNWVVDINLGAPRFFRDRFAIALGVPERANWKNMHFDEKLMQASSLENNHCKELFKHYLLKNPYLTLKLSA